MQDLMVCDVEARNLGDIAAHGQLCTPYRKPTGWRVVTHMGLRTPDSMQSEAPVLLPRP